MGALLALVLMISSVSGTTINSPDEIITVTATYSGSTTSKQYLQAVMRKINEVYYFGQTQNRRGEWIRYQSVDGSDFSNYSQNFFDFQAINSTWSGDLKVKLDVESGNFKGPGTYLLKLFRYITAGKNESDNSMEITINVASVSANTTQTSESNSSAPLSPLIEFTVPTTANLGESFKTTANLKNFAANTEFYLKIRDKAQTKNGNNFLSDNEAWNLFPLIKTDNSGNWSGEVWGMVSEDKDAGIYKIKLRARKKDTDSFFESDIKEIKLSKIVTPVIVTTPSAEINNFDVILGTHSASISSLPEQPKQKEKNKFDRLSLIILISGGIFSLAGIYGIIKRAL